MSRRSSLCVALTVVIGLWSCRLVAGTSTTTHIDIDARDLPRKLLHATQRLELTGALRRDGGELALWYPKWVPGSHAPGGPIQNVGGMTITDGEGRELTWRRTPGEVHRILTDVPAGTGELHVTFRYITNQSSANSRGLDSFGSELIGIISPNTVLVYPEEIKISDFDVTSSLTVPEGWSVATAIPMRDDGDDDTVYFDAVSLETFVDSPIMLGAHHKAYVLNEEGVSAPPHDMHVFSEAKSVIDIDEDVLAGYQRMVTECAHLFGSHPFDRFDILVATTDALGRNGLEHLRSTLNVIPQRSYRSPDDLTGWDRMLIPHEYVHAWCGKYRRPVGMATTDFHTPKATELLWVYEGLTQYLGNIIEARSGMMDVDELRWMMINRVRFARYQQGRKWRPLIDTAAASHTLRAGSPSWSHLRRGQDYYYEGAMIWMEADAIIRNGTDGERSLDDFCRAFFAYESSGPTPRPFVRADVIAALGDVYEYDWETFAKERVDRPLDRPILDVVAQLGYMIRFVGEPPEAPDGSKMTVLDARDSVGLSLSTGGEVRVVLLDSPADKAGIGPGMKVAGVGEFVWSEARFEDALNNTPIEGGIDLLLVSGDKYVTRRIEYDGGPRYLTLVRDESKADRLAEIGAPVGAE